MSVEGGCRGKAPINVVEAMRSKKSLEKRVEVGPIGGGHVKPRPQVEVDPTDPTEIFREWFRNNGNA